MMRILHKEILFQMSNITGFIILNLRKFLCEISSINKVKIQIGIICCLFLENWK